MTHNENIKTFVDLVHHLKLEDECFEAAKPNAHAYVAESSSERAFSFKHKRFNNNWKDKGKMNETRRGPKKGNKQLKHKKGKCSGRKDKTKVTCYNYSNLSHFAHECTKSKKVLSYLSSSKRSYVSKIFISSTVLLIETHSV